MATTASLTSSIPTSTSSVSGPWNPEDQQQLEAFQTFLATLLSNFVKEPERVAKYLDAEAMKVWVQAFTHDSVNVAFNYESLETKGDAVCKMVFPLYLIERFGNISSHTITSMNSLYMKGLYQTKLSKRLEFEPWIRAKVKSDKVYEDTFESFVGALHQISEMKDNYGRAAIVCNNFIVWLFDKVKINLEEVAAKKTEVDQTLTRLGLGKPELIQVGYEPGRISYRLEITPMAIKYFAQRGIYFDTIIGVGYGKTERAAENNTYEEAFERMKSAGVTRQWAEKEKLQWSFEAPEFQVYIQKARENLKKLGYDKMYFHIPRNITNYKEMSLSLVGVHEKTSEHNILDSVTVPKNNEIQGKTILIKRLSERTA